VLMGVGVLKEVLPIHTDNKQVAYMRGRIIVGF